MRPDYLAQFLADPPAEKPPVLPPTELTEAPLVSVMSGPRPAHFPTCESVAEVEDWTAGYGCTSPGTQAGRRREWPPEIAAEYEAILAAPLPPAPFALDGLHKTVTDAGRFLAALRRDVAMGPDGPRARTGALQADLEALAEVVA